MVRIHVGQPLKFPNLFNAFLTVSEKKLHPFFKDARAIKGLKKWKFTDKSTDTKIFELRARKSICSADYKSTIIACSVFPELLP